MAFVYSLVVTLVWIIIGLELPEALGGSHASHGGHPNARAAPPPHFFEASAILLSIILLGRTIEGHARRLTHESLTALAKMWPSEARLLAPEEKVIPLDLIQLGDQILISAGETLPCDGVLIAGDVQVDESILSGESRPVHKQAGDAVV